jgi:hypothetical protein
MPLPKYIVRLTDEERTDLEDLIHTGKHRAAATLIHARILLKADVGVLGATAINITAEGMGRAGSAFSLIISFSRATYYFQLFFYKLCRFGCQPASPMQARSTERRLKRTALPSC